MVMTYYKSDIESLINLLDIVNFSGGNSLSS